MPPLATAMVVPFQTPVEIVPTEVKDDETTFDAKVVPEISAAALKVIEASGSVYVLAAVRSAEVIVPVKALVVVVD